MKQPKPTHSERRATRTKRFDDVRQEIVDAAAGLINSRGVNGFTLAEVGEAVGLTNNAMKYYFRRKIDLLVTCSDQALDRLESLIDLAAEAAYPEARVRRMIDVGFARMAKITLGEEKRFVRIQELRAMNHLIQGNAFSRYDQIIERAQRLFSPAGGPCAANLVRTHVLLESIYGLSSWLDAYALADHDRVRSRLSDLLVRGLSPEAAWAPAPLAVEGGLGLDPQQAFLAAAIRLFNERGYRGTSVEMISAALHLTKGSFYHHLSSKEDLVVGCFDRSLNLMEQVQDEALKIPASYSVQLMSAVNTLVEMQFSDESLLLKQTTLLALPEELRLPMTSKSDKIARRFSGMIIDGLSDTSTPPPDPIIAGYSLRSLLNAAYEIGRTTDKESRPKLARFCAQTYFYGLFGI